MILNYANQYLCDNEFDTRFWKFPLTPYIDILNELRELKESKEIVIWDKNQSTEIFKMIIFNLYLLSKVPEIRQEIQNLEIKDFILNNNYRNIVMKQLASKNYQLLLEISNYQNEYESLIFSNSEKINIDLEYNQEIFIERCLDLIKNSDFTLEQMNEKFLTIKQEHSVVVDQKYIQNFLSIFNTLDANYLLLFLQWMEIIFSSDSILIVFVTNDFIKFLE